MYANRNVVVSEEPSEISLLHLRNGRVIRDLRQTRILWGYLSDGMALQAAVRATAVDLDKDYRQMADCLRDTIEDMRQDHMLVLWKGSEIGGRHDTAQAVIEWLVWKAETGWLRRLRVKCALAAPAVLAGQRPDALDHPEHGSEDHRGVVS